MLRKFLPLFVLGFIGVVLMIAFLVREALQEKAGEAVVEVTRELTLEESVRKKLDELILPELTLNNCTIEEAVEFLRLRSIELSEEEPANRGIGFVVRSPKTVVDEGGDEALGDGFGDGVDPKATLLTLQAKDISIAEALDLICEKAGLEWGVDEKFGKILITPLDPVKQKLAEIRIPRFELVDENLGEAIRKLTNRSYKDGENEEIVSRGMSFVVRLPNNLPDDAGSAEAMIPYTKTVSFVAEEVSFPDLMDLLCEKFGVAWKIDEFSITVYPIGIKERKFVPVEVDPDDPFSQVDYE